MQELIEEIKKDKNGFKVVSYIDNGETITYNLDKREFFTYVLFNDNKPIYVGSTSSLKARINSHKKDKGFDRYLLLGPFFNEDAARFSEKSCISLMKAIFPNNVLNKNSTGQCSEFIYV
jgi:hypothetical protein